MAKDEDETEMLNTYFTNGAEVEISSDEEGFRGAWYEGTVIRPIPKKQRRNNNDDDESSKNKLRVLVEYKTLMADKKGKNPLKETMSLVQLRPRPPPERRRRFKVSEEVDANYNDGWWEGVVMEVLDGGRYSVFFRGTRDQLEFDESQIRIHREWANGEWTPPFDEGEEEEEEDKKKLVSTEMKPNNEAAANFSEGSLVEVSSDEEGFEGAWFAATVVKLLDNCNYLVEYQYLRNSNDTEFLQEEAERLHVRPRPPDIGPFKSFKVLEEVDALHMDGWWVGVISKDLKARARQNTGDTVKCVEGQKKKNLDSSNWRNRVQATHPLDPDMNKSFSPSLARSNYNFLSPFSSLLPIFPGNALFGQPVSASPLVHWASSIHPSPCGLALVPIDILTGVMSSTAFSYVDYAQGFMPNI
ncbi:hypothetical protein RND71_000686 [Anisodus tanguticus]|uniref:Agenet domain-containing protein n=1 Tax=Anisodus tanguticus TaxID=243964 RepID=A0AAE1SXT6_9SOLA|nr:hypothetical protein RND71_000686 [Anisodus tanguticus]